MKSLLLNAKHWQLFVLLFIAPALLMLGAMAILIPTITQHTITNVNSIFEYFSYLPLLILPFILIQIAWHWYSLHLAIEVLSPEFKPSFKRSKMALSYLIIYVCLYMLLFSFLTRHIQINPITAENIATTLGIFFLMIPLHLLAVFCQCYTFYALAKSIKTIELNRKVTFSDYLGEFLLLWFFPVGIWILQPKINAILNNRRTSIDAIRNSLQ